MREFLVVALTGKDNNFGEYDVVSVINSNGEARELAKKHAQAHPGTEYAVYERKTVFCGRVIVESDEPQAPRAVGEQG